jgi:hypothetical protein
MKIEAEKDKPELSAILKRRAVRQMEPGKKSKTNGQHR